VPDGLQVARLIHSARGDADEAAAAAMPEQARSTLAAEAAMHILRRSIPAQFFVRGELQPLPLRTGIGREVTVKAPTLFAVAVYDRT